MERYTRYRFEEPRGGGGAVAGFIAVVAASAVAFAVIGAASTPPSAHAVFIDREVAASSAAQDEPAASSAGETAPALVANVVARNPAPACDPAACGQAYVSFRPSDCTYQPYEGPRRLCTR